MRVAASLVLTAVCFAQSEKEPPPKDPIRMLADTAMAAPPELAADLLIRIAESPKVTDKAFKIELLERAFSLAPSAKFKIRLWGTFGRASNTDSDTGALFAGLADGLDTLSIQSRAIRATLPLDRSKAMELFRAVPPLSIPQRTCKDAITHSADEYYALITAVFRQGFTAKERKEEKDVDLIRFTLGRMSSPSELDAASRLLLMPELAPHFGMLLTTFSGAFQQMQADDRTFSIATHGGMVTTATILRRVAAERGVSGNALWEAARTYLVRHLGAVRCADSVDPAGLGSRVGEVVRYFNETFLKEMSASGAQLRPITPEEATPSRLEGGAEVFVYWQTARTKKLLMDMKRLRFGDDLGPKALTSEQRNERAWERSVREFLKDLQRWSSDHEESEANYFHMASIIYHGLIDLIPARDLKTEVLRSYISFLAGSPMRRESPPEWYTHAKRILKELSDLTPDERVWIREEIKAGGDVVMSVLIDMETLAPPAPRK
jgi:hypothetical protein